MATRIYDAKFWRALAAQIRIQAHEIRDPISKQMMLQIAEDYQRLAESARVSDDTDLTRPSSGRP